VTRTPVLAVCVSATSQARRLARMGHAEDGHEGALFQEGAGRGQTPLSVGSFRRSAGSVGKAAGGRGFEPLRHLGRHSRPSWRA